MCTQELKIGTIPAVLYGKPAPNIWLFVHGQGGNKTEAAAFAALAAPTGWQVLGIDLPEHGDRTGETDFTPWQVVPELQTVLAYLQQHWQGIRLRANSIGAYLAMLAWEALRGPAGNQPGRLVFHAGVCRPAAYKGAVCFAGARYGAADL